MAGQTHYEMLLFRLPVVFRRKKLLFAGTALSAFLLICVKHCQGQKSAKPQGSQGLAVCFCLVPDLGSLCFQADARICSLISADCHARPGAVCLEPAASSPVPAGRLGFAFYRRGRLSVRDVAVCCSHASSYPLARRSGAFRPIEAALRPCFMAHAVEQ